MLTKPEAVELVTQEMRKLNPSIDPWVVLEEQTIERPFGWVFFYNSKRFLDTGESRYQLAGNGPVIVNRQLGTIQFCGSNQPTEELISQYEKTLIGEA